MTWRHFLLAAATLAMFIINGALLRFEDVNYSDGTTGPVDRIVDPLLVTIYSASRREGNFQAFGLPDDLARDASDKARLVYNDNERLSIMLHERPDLLTQYFCPSSGVPERYKAMHVLLEQTNSGGGFVERDVVQYNRMMSLESQEWEGTSRVGEVYNAIELVENRKIDATVMGVAAVITGRETDLFAKNAPFGNFSWSLSSLRRNHPDLDAKLVEYFALMHVLTELARDPENGICRN